MGGDFNHTASFASRMAGAKRRRAERGRDSTLAISFHIQ